MIANEHGVARMVRDWNEKVSTSQELTRTGSLVADEVEELLGACDSGDRAQIAKEACDVVWTAIDVLIAHDIDFYAAFAEVTRSNNTKIGPNGEIVRRADGKVLKGPWFESACPDALVGRRAA